MSRMNYDPPSNDSRKYIEPNNRSAAIPNNGIAALFHSTRFYVFAEIVAYINAIRHKHAYIFRQGRVHLVALKTGNLNFDLPQCRSPPLSFSSKNEKRRGEMDKDRYVWIKGEKIPVSEEVYLEYYRSVWAAKKRQMRGKRCRTVNGSRCMEDCGLCDRKPDGGVLSLDKFLDEGYETADSAEIDELVMDKILLDELYIALAELTDDERSLIDALYFKEKSERGFSKESSIPHPTVHSRKNSLLKRLRRRLEKYL